jgi:hypothetical protein
MYDMELSPVSERSGACGRMSDAPVNIAERELLRFIDSVSDMFGPDQSKFLTEIWMDALASMERMPGPTSPDWRLVSLPRQYGSRHSCWRSRIVTRWFRLS